MKILFDKYPIDILLSILYSFFFTFIALLQIESLFLIIIGLPIILFIPGYLLIFSLFPTKKTEEGIDILQRITFSIGISLAISALIAIALNFIPGNIPMKYAFIPIFIFIIVTSVIGIIRWINAVPDERFTISLELSIPKLVNKIDKILSIILVVSIIVTIITFIYVISTPKNMEQSTEFYILSSGGEAGDYIRDFNTSDNESLIIGLINHEYQTISYTIEVWLVNQTNVYNEITNENETIIINMWFIDKMNITLEHIDTQGLWKSQWEYNYTFNIKQKGENLKLTFLLFKTPTSTYYHDMDYKQIYDQKISSAYGENHLWINVY